MRALAIAMACACFVAACGASTAQHASTAKKPVVAAKAEPAPPPATPPVAPASTEPGPLPASLDAGEIQRDKLMAVLAAGPGRFLQRIKVKRDLDAQGHFAGWKLVQIFPGEAVTVPLVAGDTLLRVNGQSVEHPEQFKTLWDSLALSSELVLTVRRGVQQSDVRYRIVQEQLPP